MDQVLDRQAGVHQAERGGEQNLLRTALHRRELWLAGAAAWTAGGRARLYARTGSRSENHGQRRRGAVRPTGPVAVSRAGRGQGLLSTPAKGVCAKVTSGS